MRVTFSILLSLALSLMLVMITTLDVNAFSGTVNVEGWVDLFDLDECHFSSNGSNDYFFLEPGYQLTLEGEEEGAEVQLIMTVLNETKIVDGVETRIVEERHTEDGELVEVSRNYFAICAPENDIFYFGEEVDMYEDGEIVNHEGAWLVGVDDARPGVIIPADPRVGMKYYQEVAPDVAEDRATVVSLNEVVDTPAGQFDNVFKVEETTPLEPGVTENKFHAPGLGLIQDAEIKLVEYVLPEVKGTIGIEFKSEIQTVVVAGESIEVELNSSSTISEFKVDQENKKISFKVDGETGTNGMTEISIGKILEGPYAVTIDGQATTDFEVVNAASEGVIIISYTHSVHDVTITGTNVVPEFPLPAVGALAGVLGAAILFTRTRFHLSSNKKK